jgi:hypothetical protein
LNQAIQLIKKRADFSFCKSETLKNFSFPDLLFTQIRKMQILLLLPLEFEASSQTYSLLSVSLNEAGTQEI